jgi:hypothetical protein
MAMVRQSLPIGYDDFRVIREKRSYYVDKTLMIQEFLQLDFNVTLITRPRRFGKTLNMTMLRDFFDITQDSLSIFEGLAIMDTEYADQLNTRPVVCLSFKDCSGPTIDVMKDNFVFIMREEYGRFNRIFKGRVDREDPEYQQFYQFMDQLNSGDSPLFDFSFSLIELLKTVAHFFGQKPLLLIDEYDSPLLSALENGYKNQVIPFFAKLYSYSLKGNKYLDRAVLTGIQRVIKESIFSNLNNVSVFTVLDPFYEKFFGFTDQETEEILHYYGLTLTDDVRQWYDGYLFGGTQIYNPWSVLNYALFRKIRAYWVNTSTNLLIRESLKGAEQDFQESYEHLIEHGEVEVAANLETSFSELQTTKTLWGLLINAGYLTVTRELDQSSQLSVRIPNGEVRMELGSIFSSTHHLGSDSLDKMFAMLTTQNMDGFLDSYRKIVLESTSYYDAKENAYHMLFLGMCLSLSSMYKITSNLESGSGRSDIRMESRNAERDHMIIEFKQGEDVAVLKEAALQQILDKQYYAGLEGAVLCIGVAHDKKRCEIAYRTVQV